jgi:NADH-quinone oxidoreductase subunit N
MTLAEMQFLTPDLRLASAEIFIALMACLILMFDLLVKDRKRTTTFVATQLTLVGAAVVTFATSSGEISYTFSNMYVGDLMGDLLKLLLYLTVIVVLFYSRGYILEREQMAKGEYYVLVLFATLGMMVMISANHFVTIYVGLELLSLSLYAMVAMNRDSVPATEAAMKYFVLGAPGVRTAAVRHVDDLRRYRYPGDHGDCRTPLHGSGRQDDPRFWPRLPGFRPGLQAGCRALPHVDS